ncbi:MAG TPA: hypothetical protein VK141_00695 [Nitrosomonas sp.]|nr:hypothetical protein [Nitrosomonas sp.]
MPDKTFHLVVRFSDNLFGISDVIAKHNDVVSKYGYVWFGKMGSTLSISRMEMLNEQVSKGIPTFVYLVKGNRKKSTAYRANLLFITREFSSKEVKRTPKYYSENELVQYMKAWIKIGEIESVEMSALSNLKTTSSINSIQETLVRSSSGYFLVHESKNIF